LWRRCEAAVTYYRCDVGTVCKSILLARGAYISKPFIVSDKVVRRCEINFHLW